jgi:hypothetical protein
MAKEERCTDLVINLLGNPFKTPPIQTALESSIELYLNREFCCIPDPDSQLDNGAVWTMTRTQSNGLELLLTLSALCVLYYVGQVGSHLLDYHEP